MWARAEAIARENGYLRFLRDEAIAKRDEVQAIMQRKISRQARAIRQLEEKLRAKGQAPYAEQHVDYRKSESTGEIVPFDPGSEP